MSPAAGASWGSLRAPFTLPVARIWFTGLDKEQRSSLESSYPSYLGIAHGGSVLSRDELECRALRLDKPPDIPIAALTRGGQYAPLTVAGPEGVDLVGLNFRARVPLHPSREPGWLGVARAQELVQPIVIENFLRFFAAHQALRHGGIVLHSAGLVVGGRAYLFAGRSGAGKTTLTRKSHTAGALVLSDDVNLVLPGEGGYEAHAVPFTGEFGRTLAQTGGPAAYPVAGLVLLEQGERLRVGAVKPSAAVARLLVASPFVNTEAAVSEPLLEVLTALVARLSVIALRCRRDDEFGAIMTAVTDGFAHARAA